MHYLLQHGIRCTNAWRTREGSLKLIVAGLLWSIENKSAPNGQDNLDLAVARAQSRKLGDRTEDERGKTEDNRPRRKAIRGREGADTRTNGVLSESCTLRLDARRVVRNVGSLLTDDRLEVRASLHLRFPAAGNAKPFSTTPPYQINHLRQNLVSIGFWCQDACQSLSAISWQMIPMTSQSYPP